MTMDKINTLINKPGFFKNLAAFSANALACYIWLIVL